MKPCFALWVWLAVPALVLSTVAGAHDHDRPELGQWFKSLSSRASGPCCDGDDANHAEAEWDAGGGHYRVRIDGEWIEVPPDAIVKGPNHAGYALEWHYYAQGKPVVRCFMPGMLS